MIKTTLIAYAWLMYAPIGGMALVAPQMLTLEGAPTVFDFFDVPVTGVAMAGFLAFLLRVRLLRSGFWKKVFPLLIGWDILHTLILGQVLGVAQHHVAWDERVGWTLTLLPTYFALFLYDYRSSQLWTGPCHPNALTLLGFGAMTMGQRWILASMGGMIGIIALGLIDNWAKSD